MDASVIPVYMGFDPREEAGSHVFVSSLLEHATSPVSVIPLHLPLFRSFYAPGVRDGTNAFIYTRFLIPYLQQWRGWAIFCDGADMLLKADISELWALRDHYKAVQVVKHDYKTKHPRKYIGTQMEAANEDYPRKNWSSVMLINCGHYHWRDITPEAVEKMTGPELHRFSWLQEEMVGDLPKEWNWLDEYGPNPEAKLIHWTTGTPAFKHYAKAPHADDFRRQLAIANYVAQ